MKAIINNLLYDTDKAEKIFMYVEKRKGIPCFWDNTLCYIDKYNVSIYRTSKGNYFEHFVLVDNTDKQFIEKREIREVRKTIRDLDADAYIKIFGAVEDA